MKSAVKTTANQQQPPHSFLETHVKQAEERIASASAPGNRSDSGFISKMDSYSLEALVETKISRFLDQIGSFYPENLYALIISKVEKPLITQILKRTGGNQVHAARILGINRNTLRKKMKLYDLR